MSLDLNYHSRLNSDPNSDYPSGLNPFFNILREGYIRIGSLVRARSFLPSIPFQRSIEFSFHSTGLYFQFISSISNISSIIMNWTFKSYFHHITTYFKYLKYNSSYTNLPHCLFVFIILLIWYLLFFTIKSHFWVVWIFINKFDHHFHSFRILMHLINALGKITILPLNF